MYTITQINEMIEKHMKKVGDMRAQFHTENREPTKEERDLIQNMLDRVDELRELKAVEERVQKTNDDLSAPTTTPIKPELTENRSLITGGEDRASKEKFTSFGEQMAAIVRADTPGQTIDPRLLTVRAASGLNETIPSDGGWLVQQDFSSEILKQVFETGLLASRCRRMTISGNSNSLKINGIDETSRAAGSRWGGVRGYWTEEAGEKTKSKPKFRKIELNLNKLVGLCYATDELLDDASALEGVIRQAFVSEFGFLIDDAIINGLGAGQPLGVMNAGCLITESKETGQLAATIVYENIVKMWSRLFASSRANSVWLISQDTEPQLFTMSLAVGTGGAPVYLPPGGASVSPYSTLFGRPVIPIEQCATLGTTGDIMLADLGGYILADKGNIKSDVSIHVRFIYDESVFRFVMRLDGQPILASTVTPANAGSTQSHFIVLETRS